MIERGPILDHLTPPPVVDKSSNEGEVHGVQSIGIPPADEIDAHIEGVDDMERRLAAHYLDIEPLTPDERLALFIEHNQTAEAPIQREQSQSPIKQIE
jgi:hypothetical protein